MRASERLSCYLFREPTSRKALHASCNARSQQWWLLSHTALRQWVDRRLCRGIQPPRLLHGPCGVTNRAVAAASGATPHRLTGAAAAGQPVRGHAQPYHGVRSSIAQSCAQPCQGRGLRPCPRTRPAGRTLWPGAGAARRPASARRAPRRWRGPAARRPLRRPPPRAGRWAG